MAELLEAEGRPMVDDLFRKHALEMEKVTTKERHSVRGSAVLVMEVVWCCC